MKIKRLNFNKLLVSILMLIILTGLLYPIVMNIRLLKILN